MTQKKDIARLELYTNAKRKNLRQIVAEKGPDIALTGVFYNYKWAPACPLKADGKVLWKTALYNYEGMGFDTGPDIRPVVIPKGGALAQRNYFANCVLISNGRKKAKLYYNADVGGVRGRVATALTEDALYTFYSTDGSAMAMTPERLRDWLFANVPGVVSAAMHDGGGKVNYYDRAAGILSQGKEPSQNLLLVYLKKPGEPEGPERAEESEGAEESEETESAGKPEGPERAEPAEKTEPIGVGKTVTASSLYVRATPGGKAVGGVRRGDAVTVYEVKNAWSRIGTNRWVASRYLK